MAGLAIGAGEKMSCAMQMQRMMLLACVKVARGM
ncbi:hypothetical protein QBD01_002663 [Ochrobactrum sp. 19YEA23]|nr:hypothetical protein [Ochrobactrum sp. 19YEA23]